MADGHQFAVIGLEHLAWPESLRLPGPRFRLFVAADTSRAEVGEISRFAEAALAAGMVYLCAWGPGCGRFHDIVDEVLADDAVSDARRFTPPTDHDVVMTTWHEHESLEEALDFLATLALPTEGYLAGSGYRLVICVGRADWAATARRFMSDAPFLI